MIYIPIVSKLQRKGDIYAYSEWMVPDCDKFIFSDIKIFDSNYPEYSATFLFMGDAQNIQSFKGQL